MFGLSVVLLSGVVGAFSGAFSALLGAVFQYTPPTTIAAVLAEIQAAFDPYLPTSTISLFVVFALVITAGFFLLRKVLRTGK